MGDVIRLRRFNARGIEALVAEIEKADKLLSESPMWLLEDSSLTEPLASGATILRKPPETKIEMATRVNVALGFRFQDYAGDVGLWAWLSLLWIDATMPYEPAAKGRPLKQIASYVPQMSPNGGPVQMTFRHLVWGPAFLQARYKAHARALLSGPVHVYPDSLDNMVWANIMNDSIMEACDLLYYDPVENALVGNAAASRQRNRVPGEQRKGSIVDFVGFLKRVDRTHSIGRLSVSRIIDMLPPNEFGPYIENARRRLVLTG